MVRKRSTAHLLNYLVRRSGVIGYEGFVSLQLKREHSRSSPPLHAAKVTSLSVPRPRITRRNLSGTLVEARFLSVTLTNEAVVDLSRALGVKEGAEFMV